MRFSAVAASAVVVGFAVALPGVVYETEVVTIHSCPPDKTDCPYRTQAPSPVYGSEPATTSCDESSVIAKPAYPTTTSCDESSVIAKPAYPTTTSCDESSVIAEPHYPTSTPCEESSVIAEPHYPTSTPCESSVIAEPHYPTSTPCSESSVIAKPAYPTTTCDESSVIAKPAYPTTTCSESSVIAKPHYPTASSESGPVYTPHPVYPNNTIPSHSYGKPAPYSKLSGEYKTPSAYAPHSYPTVHPNASSPYPAASEGSGSQMGVSIVAIAGAAALFFFA